jgi:putative two-component system response regulator
MSRRPTTRPSGPRVLCVDDEPVMLRLVSRLLERMHLSVATAADPGEALRLFDTERFDLIITDIRMPHMDGHAFLAEIRARDAEVPVIVATGHASLDNAIRALRDGASGMLIKPFTGEEFTTEVTNALQRARLRHDALQYQFVTPILDGVALALTAAIEARDLETGAHCMQLGTMGERVARLMDLSEQERTTIRIGGYLHDVGKIAIADRILLKPGPLTDDEYREMQRHAEIGGAIVQTHEAMTAIASIVRHHHERYDGAGYPDRLAGEAIPVGARIIAIADAFSAMTNDRVYRKAIGVEAAWEEIRRNAGGQFDPAIVEAFELARVPDDAVPGASPGPAATPSAAAAAKTPPAAAAAAAGRKRADDEAGSPPAKSTKSRPGVEARG